MHPREVATIMRVPPRAVSMVQYRARNAGARKRACDLQKRYQAHRRWTAERDAYEAAWLGQVAEPICVQTQR
jgi:hypothetical protein